MNDITKHYRFQRIMIEAAQYRMLREIFKTDPAVDVKTASLLRDIFASDRDDVAYFKKNATA
jgi:hypothetical protein